MPEQMPMTVTKNADGRWFDVGSSGVVVASFRTQAEAWSYVDRGDPVSEQRAQFWWQRD